MGNAVQEVLGSGGCARGRGGRIMATAFRCEVAGIDMKAAIVGSRIVGASESCGSEASLRNGTSTLWRFKKTRHRTNKADRV